MTLLQAVTISSLGIAGSVCLYHALLATWTREVLTWSGGKAILLGLPAYEDQGVGYHHPHVENLQNGLRGIHAGLASFKKLPAHYQGIALYAEWVMDPREWKFLREKFLKNP